MKRFLLLAALMLLAAADSPPPYLQPADMPDLSLILPKPPAHGSAEAVADRAVFDATRRLRGSSRWALATRDVTDDRYTVFACAIGARLDARSAPALARVFARMSDAGMVQRAKDGFAVRRPYLGTDRPICEPKTAHLAANGDYPSGHTSGGWSTALILAELLPDRATAILRRGRHYGESRYICGAHSRSAVEAGFMAGSVLVARLHAAPDFRRDMDAARDELARALTTVTPIEPALCRQEAAL